MSLVLLDTCAILWLVGGIPPREAGVPEVIEAARFDDAVLVSPISAWEIATEGAQAAGQVGALAVAARCLSPHRRSARHARGAPDGRDPDRFPWRSKAVDPGRADRMIVATAEAMAARIVRADRRILDYAEGSIDYSRPAP